MQTIEEVLARAYSMPPHLAAIYLSRPFLLWAEHYYQKDVYQRNLFRIFEEFPKFNFTDEQKTELSELGEEILDFKDYSPDLSLTELFTIKPTELRKALDRNDRFVEKLYKLDGLGDRQIVPALQIGLSIHDKGTEIFKTFYTLPHILKDELRYAHKISSYFFKTFETVQKEFAALVYEVLDNPKLCKWAGVIIEEYERFYEQLLKILDQYQIAEVPEWREYLLKLKEKVAELP